MYQKIFHFIKYNNAFTIIFVICFFGFGISFAASPQVRDSIYSSAETVISVDNGLIVSVDLDNFNFNLRINSVTEDGKNYYAVYSYQTLAIEDDFWQSKEIEKTLIVSKEVLVGKDLGLYLAEELGENINYELSYLKRVQKLEKERGESQKVVTVEYSGLIGKLLNPEEKVIEGYSPVIPEPVPEVPVTVESNPAAVIVSTPYTELQENPAPESQLEAGPPASTSESEAGPPAETPQNGDAITIEQASTTPQEESEQESQSEIGPPASTSESEAGPPAETPLPTPEDMVDEELIQEVVEELLQNQATSTPPESTPPESTPPESTPPESTPPESTPPESTPPESTPEPAIEPVSEPTPDSPVE